MNIELDALSDEWAWRLDVRRKPIAVSQQTVTRLPWETRLFGTPPIDGLPLVGKVPDHQMASNEIARQACVALFADMDVDSFTLLDVVKVVRKSQDMLESMDRGFKHEIWFLTHHAEAYCVRWARQSVMDVMPKANVAGQSVDTALKAVEKVFMDCKTQSCSGALQS